MSRQLSSPGAVVCWRAINRKQTGPRDAEVLPTYPCTGGHHSRGVRRGRHGAGCRGGAVVLENHDLHLCRQRKKQEDLTL